MQILLHYLSVLNFFLKLVFPKSGTATLVCPKAAGFSFDINQTFDQSLVGRLSFGFSVVKKFAIQMIDQFLFFRRLRANICRLSADDPIVMRGAMLKVSEEPGLIIFQQRVLHYEQIYSQVLIILNIGKMDASIEAKQQFLRVQILEAGYDPEDFIQFMNTNSSIQSPSIETLTLDQLTRIVSSYQQQVKKRTTELAQQPNKNKDEEIKHHSPPKSEKKIFTQERLKNLEEKKNKIDYDRYGIFDYEFKALMNCIQADRLTTQKQIEITIPEMETKETQGYLFGIGAKVQYYYVIKSNLIKGTVKRVSEDFDWLNATLLRLYPFLQLPELQPVRKDIKDPYVRRKKDIEEYLQHLCQKPYLCSSYVFVDFLTLSLQKMQKYKKSYDSMGFVKGVSLMKTQQGNVELDLSNRTRQLYNSSKQFSRKTSQIHETIGAAITKMLESYRTAMLDTYTVVDMFAELHDIYGEISNKFPTFKKQQYNDTLVNLNNLFLGIGDNLKNVTETIETYTKDYYRFYNGLDRNLQKLQRLVKESQNQYLQFKLNLKRKKQRVISDPSRWDIEDRDIDVKKLSKEELMKYILPKEVLAQNDLKAWYAFNLKNYENQLVAYIRYITRRYQKVFRLMAVDLLGNDKSYLESLTKFIGQSRKIQNVTLQKSSG